MAGDWSAEEVTTIVQDYLAMLAAELASQPYNKTVHRDALRARLEGRSDGSIEFKHANISAWMIENGLPYVNGYRPRANYQRLIGEIAVRELKNAGALERAIRDQAEMIPNELRQLEVCARPEPVAQSQHGGPAATSHLPDFAAMQEANRQLGDSGERAVLAHEKRRLSHVGRDDLAGNVRWVAQLEGPQAGYDVLSFEPSGTPKRIEVKTTNFGRYSPFFLTAHELDVSQQLGSQYSLYRLFDFSRQGKMFELHPPLSAWCKLQPSVYRATIGA